MKLIRIFVEHRLAANLGMVLMALGGVWAITKLTVQLNPDVPRPYVNTQIAWRGASAEDVEKLVTTPLEQQLKTLTEVKAIYSVTRDTSSFVQVEIEADANVQDAVDRIKQQVSQIRSFPVEIEPPVVYEVRRSDLVAAVLVTGNGSIEELIPLARQMQDEMLGRGLDIVEFNGLPTQEIAIQVDGRTLFRAGSDVRRTRYPACGAFHGRSRRHNRQRRAFRASCAAWISGAAPASSKTCRFARLPVPWRVWATSPRSSAGRWWISPP